MQLQAGTVLRDYKIEKLLGQGGMGTVYLAKDSFLDRHVAIKELSPLLTADTGLVERFRNEAKLQAKLIHANIAILHNFFEHNNRYYMVMEYAEGETLKEIIMRTGPIPEMRTINILKQLVFALKYAHGMGIIHRDIKPSNIIINSNDEVKILDFGIARVVGERGLTQTGQQLGTVAYMSPEQVQAEKDIDGKTDVYSLGVTLFEMLSGHMLYDLNTESDFVVMNKIVGNALPDPRDSYPHISENTVELLRSMTEKDRNVRININQMIDGISNIEKVQLEKDHFMREIQDNQTEEEDKHSSITVDTEDIANDEKQDQSEEEGKNNYISVNIDDDATDEIQNLPAIIAFIAIVTVLFVFVLIFTITTN